MKLTFGGTGVVHSQGRIDVAHPVVDARKVGSRIFVLCDYMAFPEDEPARNLYAYDLDGEQLWQAEDIGLGAVDGYTSVTSEDPLVVSNFAGYECTIDPSSGHYQVGAQFRSPRARKAMKKKAEWPNIGFESDCFKVAWGL